MIEDKQLIDELSVLRNEMRQLRVVGQDEQWLQSLDELDKTASRIQTLEHPTRARTELRNTVGEIMTKWLRESNVRPISRRLAEIAGKYGLWSFIID